ncbi:hypothetical protein [Lichenibacterium ramalinae]|uniref:hypothetical protein n=1 Tax=Lichenibacterium ramalinae TaxID=2316527 RepID=UPI00100E2468|nr:hypothetical protein [Lichenibacterium ramalinae]
MTPREADDQAISVGLPPSYDGFADLGDITVGVTWWLPLAVFFYAWRDLNRVRIEWERYRTWGRYLWRDPVTDPQVMSLEAAEEMLIDDLRAGLLKAFGATEDRATVLISHTEWETLTIQKENQLWWATDENGAVRYKAIFVLRHEVVPLWLQEVALAAGSSARRERSGSSQGGRILESVRHFWNHTLYV